MTNKPTYKQLEEEVEKLKESVRNNFYMEQALNSIGSAIMIFDPDLSILSANMAAEKITGQPLNELKGKKCFQIFHDPKSTSPPESCPLHKVIVTGKIERVEMIEKNLKGTFFVSCVPVHDNNADLKWIIHINTKVDERSEVDKVYFDSEKKFRLLAENIPEVFWMSTPGIKEMVYINPAYEKVWGRSRESLYEKPQSFMEAIHPDDYSRIEAGVEEHSRGKWNFKYRMIRPDGNIRWIQDQGFPILDDEGNLELMCGIAADITPLKEVEIALRKSEEKYRDLYENAPLAYFSVSPVDGSILNCNKAAVRLLGFNMKTMKKLRVFDLYAETSNGLSKAKKVFTKFKTGQLTSSVELQMKKKDGEIFWVSLSVKPIKDIDGNIIESRSIVMDINERKQMEMALKQNERALIKQTRHLEEVNTALNVLVQRRQEEQDKFEERILSNVKSLVFPYIEKMKLKRPSSENATYLDIIRSNLEDLISPFYSNLISRHVGLTPKELQIAQLIKNGHTSKEIASILNVSLNSISVHRYNIRKKLNLLNKKVNLVSYLQSSSI